MRGGKRKPTKLRILEGNPGKRPLPKDEPEPESIADPASVDYPPDLLGDKMDVARKLWDHLLPLVSDMRVMTVADVQALILCCLAWQEYSDAMKVVREVGMTYDGVTQTGDKIIRRHPATLVAADAFRRHKSFLIEFGLTPSARARVKTVGDKPADPLSQFLNGAKKKA